MKKNYLFGLCLLINLSFTLAQAHFWEPLKSEDLPDLGERRILPHQSAIHALDTLALQVFLQAVPHEDAVSAGQSPAVLQLPRPDGSLEAFRLVRYDMMEPELAETWSFAHTFRGISQRNPQTIIRLDWTQRGLHAMVYEPGNTWYIDPYFWEDRRFYQSYAKSDYPAPAESFYCGVGDELIDRDFEKPSGTSSRAGDCMLRSYRFAVACTGEYTAYHGGTVDAAASAVVTTMNRVNGVFERDLAIRLLLINNNNTIIYTNSGSDPYTNGNPSAMITENQSNIDAEIGTSNYDIGHVFGTNSGGLASLRSPCNVNRKARGVTGSGNPVGDPFDIDYVAHEIGHQFGGNHTQNNSCNRSSASMEPGSASTIMGYAGICSPNVQGNSDDYFHGVSIQEISNYMESGSGNNCAFILSSDNTNPAIVPGMDYTIPASTPFVLTATAADADEHPLTYCWEQFDPEVGAIMPPDETNLQGPLFRSFDPVSAPNRYFPALTDLVNNVDPTWEELPAVSRDMTFRVTVRDFYTDPNDVLKNHGCTIEDEVVVTADASAGPFLVLSPNTAVTWYEGETKIISWDVAGTAAAPVSCANVAITLSYDGGLTYPTTLVASTPNDGSASIVVPVGTTSNARVRVQCVDNIFFDISNTDFTIAPAQAPDYTLEDLSGTQTICGGTNSAQYIIRTSSIFSYNAPITLSMTSAPPGVNASFNPNPVSPGNDATLTLSNLGGLAPGNYTITVEAASTSGTKSVDLSLTVIQAANQALLVSPADGASNLDLFPFFDWADAAGANYYFLQITDDPSFNTILISESVTVSEYQLATALSGNSVYYWRVTSGSNNCGLAAPSAVNAFTTRNCFFYPSADVPQIISSSGTPTITSTVNIPLGGTIDDVDLIGLDVQHSYTGDLVVTLAKPGGTDAELFSQICGASDDLFLSLDDDSALSLTASCPPTDGRYYSPEDDPLSTLSGPTTSGDWTLTIEDVADIDGGSLDGWGIRVCYSSLLPVEWLSFDAEPMEQAIDLDWTTGEESGNAGFDVERRVAYEPGFKAIGWMPATTNLQNVNDYHFTDKEVLPGVLYHYRLRQVDFDGQDDYSEIRSARILSKEPQLSCYPNPTKGSLHLGVWGVEQDVEGVLLDAQGRLVEKVYLPANSPTTQDFSHLPSGVYWLKLRSDQWEATQRIVLLP